jgi:hypothetical protein
VTHIFVDESHHARGGFTLGAYLFFDADPAGLVLNALVQTGLTPRVDEYKSRHPHGTDERWIKLRHSLYRIAQMATIGIVVAPHVDRSLGLHVLAGLTHILRENEVSRPAHVFLDEGLFSSEQRLATWRREAGLPDELQVVAECDSRLHPGIQVADLVAHTCSVALLGRLGISDKTIYSESEGEHQLSFEMWARLRWHFFTRPVTDPALREAAASGLVDSHGGLYLAPGLDPVVAEMAEERFGMTWLGCIH